MKVARTPRIWVESGIHATDSTGNTSSNTVELSKRSSHHLLTVLRASDGDIIELFNGDGHNYTAQLKLDGKKVFASIQSTTQNLSESPLHTTLVQSISRGDRMDTSVQKSVELGVTHIQPVYTQHAIPMLKGERAQRKRDHWQAIAISAAEQSGRSYVPTVSAPLTLNSWLQESWPAATADGTRGWVLDPNANHTLATSADHANGHKPQRHAILIGPETGLSEQEVAATVAVGFNAVRFGPRTLRTETAGPAVLAALQTFAGDLLT